MRDRTDLSRRARVLMMPKRIRIVTLSGVLMLSIALGASAGSGMAEGDNVPIQIHANGFGNPNNIGIVYMEAHEGRLYAGTWNRVDGCLVHASTDGSAWEPVNASGFGDKGNQAVVRMRSYGEYLYVGTWNNRTGGQLWRAIAPRAQSDWEQVTGNGFGNPANLTLCSIRPFNGWLYVGLFNPSQGEEVWRSRDGAPGSFVKSFDGGLGIAGATDASCLYEWNGLLYLGTEAAQPPYSGCSVWRTSGPDEFGKETWVQVSPLGFGDSKTFNAFRMVESQGNLYVGTWGFGASSFTTALGLKGTTVWRTGGQGDGIFTDWEQVNADGFDDVRHDSTLAMRVVGGKLYVGGFGDHGFLFVTEDGVTWREITTAGFLERTEFGIHALVEFNGDLYIGMQNWTKPCELWALRGPIEGRSDLAAPEDVARNGEK